MRGDFFDTNVLVYAASRDGRKAEIAERLIDTGGTISVQVLNDFASVVVRKGLLDWSKTREYLGGIRLVLSVEALTAQVHDTALRVIEAYRLNLYDACIVASALEAHCTRLYTEDMHDGLVIDGRLTVINPFA